MSGEQHVPKAWGQALIQRCQVAEAVIGRTAELVRAEAPRGQLALVLANPLPPHPGPVPEVRALPDREEISHELWRHSSTPPCGSDDCPHADGEGDGDYECSCPECWSAWLDLADAVLALFGQEGQR